MCHLCSFDYNGLQHIPRNYAKNSICTLSFLQNFETLEKNHCNALIIFFKQFWHTFMILLSLMVRLFCALSHSSDMMTTQSQGTNTNFSFITKCQRQRLSNRVWGQCDIWNTSKMFLEQMRILVLCFPPQFVQEIKAQCLSHNALQNTSGVNAKSQ